ncbi:MAG TPA: beta-propeller fold lactonase family protein [Terracidiphilus sp.]|nr:beta-propeller fold lactonase family protein [Terracidiphilus sp.]
MCTGKNRLRAVFAAAALASLLGVTSPSSQAQGYSGEVYTITNQPSGNSVVVLHRAANGTLTLAGSYPTGGAGLGTGADPLGSQGAVALSQSDLMLFAVNAGSNQVSAFVVDGDRLYLMNTVSSGGVEPVSVAVHGRLVYVVNAGGTPDIAGFFIDPRTNHLVPLPGSERPLAGGAAASPGEISFSLDGNLLMVTEKGTQTIDTFTVNWNGTVSGPISNHSSGSTPFGFEFSHGGLAIVSEAATTSNALSSYRAGYNGELKLITGSLGNGQQGVCWAVVTSDGRYAYSINAASGTISSYAVSPDGALTLLNPVAASTAAGSVPTDPALSADSRFLYVRDGGENEVYAFRVEEDGSLTPLGSTGGLPAGGQGLAAF